MLVVVNTAARAGKAVRSWNMIRAALPGELNGANTLILNESPDWDQKIKKAILDGERRFVAAGGDGTVNLLLQKLVQYAGPDLLPKLNLGAIGLGSSNDFHKPLSAANRYSSCPVHINFSSTIRRDVGVLAFRDDRNFWQTRYWLLNASIGVTADANARFNRPGGLLKVLKKTSPSLAILYTAISAILNFRNKTVSIEFDGAPARQVRLSNLAVLKSPHVSGSFCYEFPAEYDSGQFYIHLCRGMHAGRLLQMLMHLSRGRLRGLPGTNSFKMNKLAVKADRPFNVEFDGEVISTRQARFTLYPARIGVCS